MTPPQSLPTHRDLPDPARKSARQQMTRSNRPRRAVSPKQVQWPNDASRRLDRTWCGPMKFPFVARDACERLS